MKKHLLMLFAAVTVASMSLNARVVLIDEGFENGIQDSIWTQEYAVGHASWAVEGLDDNLAYPSTVKQGTKRAFLRNNTGETQGYVTRLVSKVMDLRPTKVYLPELSFWYANPKWGADRDTLRVLYRTGRNARWKQLAEFSTAMSNWQRVKLSLPEVGATYQIAFEGTDNLGRGIVLDSIKLQSAPECTIPYDLMATNRGAGRVNIAWTASYDADYYELVVCKDTIDPDLADEVDPERMAFHGLISDVTSQELSLETGEFYLVYVRSLCESENSAWSSEASPDGPFGFWVRNARQVPFTEQFNSLAGLADPTRDPEWIWGSNTNNPNPYVNTRTTSAKTRANYSPDSTAAVIFSGGSTLSPSTFIPADRYVYLATPAISDTTKSDFSISQCQVHFWGTVYNNTGRQYGSGIIVGVMTDPEDITTFVPVDTVTVWNNKTFVESIVDLGSYRGNGGYLAFVSDFDRQNLFYMDNVTVEYRKTINKVTKISVNPRDTYATISWEGNAPSYDVLITNEEVNPANPKASAVVDRATAVTGNSYLCRALEADHSWNRPYYVYVKAEGTEWSYRYPFVTIAAQRAIPYSYNFESSTPVYNIEAGDQTVYAVGLGVFGNSGAYPAVESNANKSYAGSGYMYLNKRGGTDAWVTLPMVENLDSVQVKFYLSGNDTYMQAHATVGIMTNPMDINTFIPVSSFKLNTTGYTRCYTNFENYNGPDGVIAIVWDDVMNMSQNTINYIDELVVEELSECVPPTDLDLEIAPDTLTVRWQSALSDEWEFYLSRTPLTESQRMHKSLEDLASLPSVVVAQRLNWFNQSSTPVFGFGNLIPHTNYYIYMRATCDLDWWVEQAFATPCRAETFPYKETFENYNVNSTVAGCWQLADYMGVDYPRIYQAGTTSYSNKTLELYSSGTTHRSVAILPEVEGALSSMLLSFDARTYEGTASSEGILYIGSMEDITNKYSFVPFDTIYVNKGSEYTQVRLKLSDYVLAYENIAITTGIGTLQMNSDVIIDNVQLKDPSCVEAYDYVQVGAEPNSVNLTWSGLSPYERWEVKVLTNNVALSAVKNGIYNKSYAIVDDTVVVGNALYVDGLQSKRNYYVYVRALCGDSIWTTTSVYTSCDLLDPAKANKETFDSYSTGTGSVPDCWISGNANPDATSSYLPYIYSSSTYSHSGSNTFRMYGYSNYNPAYVVSPAIKCNHMKEVAVNFYMYAGTSYSWVCGVMSDPNDLSTFVVIDSVKGTGTSTQYTYDLTDYESIIPADARYFAWRTPYGTGTNYAYLDDVSFVSVACPLTKPSISDLTTNSVRVSSGLRTNDRWILLVTNREISESDLGRQNYTVPAAYVVYRDTIDRRSKEIFNLKSQTKYYVATATLCSDSVMSAWSTLNFTTPCEAKTPEQIGVITFSEEEGFTTGTSGELPCWTVGSKTQSASASYIPYIEATSGTMHNGHRYLKLYDYVSGTSTVNVGAHAIMPELGVDSISKYQVNFWGRSYNSTSYNNQVIVGVVTDPSDLNTFVPVDTLNLSKTAWDPYSVSFENYMGDYMGDYGKNIMFLSEFGMTNYAYISEISVEPIPTCRPISSFSVDSVSEDAAVISWKGHQNTYRLLLADKALQDKEKAGYMYLLDTIVNSSENILITGLRPTTNYYAYAQGICEDGDSTAISLVYAGIRTTCPTREGVPVPFFDDFEGYEIGEKSPGCWQLLCTGTRSSFYEVREVTGAGVKAIDVYSTTSNGCYMVVPKVDADLASLKLSFSARSYGGSTATKMYVGVMADVNDVNTFVLLRTFDLGATAAFTKCEMLLGDCDLVYDNLVITAGIPNITPSCYDVYLSEVGLEYVSSCNAPKIKSVSTTFNTVEVAITPSKKEDTRWELVIIPEETHDRISNITAYLNNAPSTIVNITQVVFDELQPATSYYIYARTLCVDEYSESSWMRTPLKVHTQFYFADTYSFGFEKEGERWERSPYSESDMFYLNPALVSGRDSSTVGTQSPMDYPHSRQNTDVQLYARTGDGALLMYSTEEAYGGYIIFPPLSQPQARSFEFKLRSGYLSELKYPRSSYDGLLEVGVIDKNTNFDTYQPLATVRISALDSTIQGKSKNNLLYSYYTLDLDSATVADKQMVLHAPKQPGETAYLFVDDVTMGATKGYSLVAFDKIVADGNSALVEWQNIGGPWNLYIRDENGSIIRSYLNLTNVTSQLVEDLLPRSQYSAQLEAAGVNSGSYVTTDRLTFRTQCLAMEPSAYKHDFVWDFDADYDYEANDVLAGTGTDSLYLKPACFNVGLTYKKPVNGYQWLIQRKGYEYNGPQTGYNATRKYEIGRNDSKSLRIHTTAANYNSYIVLPELNCGFDTMMIEFYGRCFANFDQTYGTPANRGRIADAQYLNPMYSQSIVVGTLTDPTDFSTLQVLDTLTYSQTHLTSGDNVNNDPTGLRYWELMQLPLSDAAGKYIVLFQPAAGLFFMDDLSVKPVGNTLFKPSGLRTSDITPTSATLSWSVRHPNLSSVVVLLNASGVEIRRETVTGTTYALTNLQPAKIYQWYVYQTDGQNNSPAAKTVSFASECVTVSPEYTCGFEVEEGAANIPGQTNYTQTLCWTYGDAIQGEWSSATYGPYNQANAGGSRYSFAGDHAVMMRAVSNTRGNSYQPYIAMPAMEVEAFDTLQVKFWMRPAYISASTGAVATSYTATNYSKSVIVGTMTDPTDAATFVPLDTVTYDGTLSSADVATEANNYLFQQMKVELVGATGPYVTFMTSFVEKGSTNKKTGDYVWIDDITFEHKQECKDPTNLQSLLVATSHATLAWDDIDSAGMYILQVSTDPYFADEEAFVFNHEVDTNVVTVEGLQPMTTYVWRVQALCGDKWGNSSFTAKQSFKTVRSPFFVEEFDAVVNANDWLFSKTHADNVVDTTGVIMRGLDDWSFIRNTTNFGLEGAHYTSKGYSGDYHWMITPTFYLPEDDSVHFSMDLALTALNSAHAVTGNAVTNNDMKDDYYFMIIVSDDGGATWKSENILAKWQNTNPEGQQLRDIATTGQKVRFSLAPYAGKNVRIGLYREAKTTSSTGIAIHVDNVRLAYFDKTSEGASTCQYEDVTVGDVVLSGDDATPGMHYYPICFYKANEAAQAGARDSVHSIEIEVYPSEETVFADTICEGQTYTGYDFQPKERTGIYRRKLTTMEHGCDSIVSLYLYVTETRRAEDVEVGICPGESYIWNGKPYNRAGIFRDTLVSSLGCDSIETLVVTYNPTTDTLRRQTRIYQSDLPFTYENDEYPYAIGQDPISYPEGTPVGDYVDTVIVRAEYCNTVLIHTLTIIQSQDLENVFGDDAHGARKILYRDQLYIILNDEWYNAAGQKVSDPRL